MTTLNIYITQDDYKTNADSIDLYIITHETVRDDTFVKLTITVPKLCDLLSKLDTKLDIHSDLNAEPQHRGHYNSVLPIIMFLIYVLNNVDNSSQLVQTITTIYKTECDRNNLLLFGASLKSIDKNAWRYLPAKILPRQDCISRLKYIFNTSKDDSHIEITVEYLKQLANFDNLIGITNIEYESFIRCVSLALEQNCPKMRKLLLTSNFFSQLKQCLELSSHKSNLTDCFTSLFMYAVELEQYDAVSELLELIHPVKIRLGLDEFVESEIVCLPHKSIVYLFDLIVDKRIICKEKHIDIVLSSYWILGERESFMYIATLYPLAVDAELISIVESSKMKKKWYVKELKKIMKENAELMKELE